MKWISNASIGEDAKNGTIFKLEGTEVRIHHYAGCGGLWFLEYKPLDISLYALGTEDFENAKKKALDYILNQFGKLTARVKIDTDFLNVSMKESDRFSRH
nr:MAG TPA: hypothetical protein [Caudoviricetes sp.]